MRRGHARKLLKTYACLFTTRAVDIELVSDLTTDGFLSALGRFTDRRGYPSIIMSDNGTNFVGANRALKDLHKNCSLTSLLKTEFTHLLPLMKSVGNFHLVASLILVAFGNRE